MRAVDDRAKVLEVEFHRSGKIPRFESLAFEPMHDRLVAEMLAVFQADDVPAYLDVVAQEYLHEGRQAFRELGLSGSRFLQSGKDVDVLLWRGSQMNAVFAFALVAAGLDCVVTDVGVTVAGATVEEVEAIVAGIAERPIAVEDIADFVENLENAKFDERVPDALLRKLWARANAGAASQLSEQAFSMLERSNQSN